MKSIILFSIVILSLIISSSSCNPPNEKNEIVNKNYADPKNELLAAKQKLFEQENQLVEQEKINLENQKKASEALALEQAKNLANKSLLHLNRENNYEADYNNPYDMIENFLIAENSRDFDYIFGFFSSNLRRYYGHMRPTYYSLQDLYQKSWNTNSYSKNTLLTIDPINENVFLVRIEYNWRKFNSSKLNSKEDLLKFVLDNDDRIIEVFSIN